jgi:hypothetical protein
MSTCKLVICVCAHPELLLFQAASLKKFLKQPVDLCIVDDSKDEATSSEFKRISDANSFEYIRNPLHHPLREAPSMRHADTLQHGFARMTPPTHTYVGTIDADLFLVTPLDLDLALQEKNILCVRHVREHIYYFWPGLCIWRLAEHPTLHTFKWDIGEDRGIRMDTGGTTYYYWLENQENIKTLEIKEHQFLHIPRTDWAPLLLTLPNPLLDFCVFDINHADSMGIQWWSDLYVCPNNTFTFFHLRDITNWQGVAENYLKTKCENFLQALTVVLRT